jgi:endonuclease-3 related protein
MSESSSYKLARLLRILRGKYGPLEWWPGSAEEVMIGAILTQQTRWRNVEIALQNLKDLGICSMKGIDASPASVVEEAIRCTGFYRVKTRRLKALAHYVIANYGGVEGMRHRPLHELREGLLSVHGIGEETADSILCYGFHLPSFVIDAYTERICGCAGIPEKKGALKRMFERLLPEDAEEYRHCHAHFVEFAKEYCGKNRCDTCRIKSLNE